MQLKKKRLALRKSLHPAIGWWLLRTIILQRIVMRKLISKSNDLYPPNTIPKSPRLTINSIYLYWSSVALLESNSLLGRWSGFDLRSTPL